MATELKITINDDGQLSVSGPIQNKLLSYGMLMVAMDAIRDQHEANSRLIQPVSMLPPKVPGFPSAQ